MKTFKTVEELRGYLAKLDSNFSVVANTDKKTGCVFYNTEYAGDYYVNSKNQIELALSRKFIPEYH
jgi:hypothetical protein